MQTRGWTPSASGAQDKCVSFFRVKNVVLTRCRCAHPPVCIRTHNNDHVRTLTILQSMSEFGGLRTHEKTIAVDARSQRARASSNSVRHDQSLHHHFFRSRAGRTLWSASPPKQDRPGRHCSLSFDTAICHCGNGDQTPEHVLQACPLFDDHRKGVWPIETNVETKL